MTDNQIEEDNDGRRFQESRVTCPRCFRATNSLKCYDILNVGFFLIQIIWNYDRVIACPSCMRRCLLNRCLIAIPLANILFPLVGCVYFCQFLGTLFTGHSDDAVAEANRVSRDELIANLPAVVSLGKPRRRELLVLGIVLIFCAGLAVFVITNAEPASMIGGRRVDEWIADLEDPAKRDQAMAVLSKAGPKARAAVSALRKLAIEDQDVWTRRLAYGALMEIDPNTTRGVPIP